MSKVAQAQVVSWLRQASAELHVPLSAQEMTALAAIPSRESKYETGAYNINGRTRDRSWGLFQLNTLGGLWQEYAGLGLTDEHQLLDGYTNVKAAVYLVAKNRQTFGNGLWPWGPYKGMSPTYGVDQSVLNSAAQLVGSGATSAVPGGGVSVSGGNPGRSGNNAVDQMIQWALSNALGKPYRFATTGPDSFDCSGLVTAMYRTIGIDLPAYTRSAVRMGRHVDLANIRPGDAVYSDGAEPPFGHVKIYIGNGQTIAAPRTGDVVKIQALNPSEITEIRRYVADDVANTASGSRDGRTVSGVSDTGSIVTAPVTDPSGQSVASSLANADDATVRQYVRDNFGWIAGFLDDPELGHILMQSAREGWSSQRLDGALKSTMWWKNKDDAQRAWIQKNAENPGQVQTDLATRTGDIIDIAGQLGVQLSTAQISQLAEESLKNGWTTNQLRDTVIGNINWNPTDKTTMGQLQFTKSEMKALGKKYLMTIDDAQAQQWAVAINSNQLTPEGVEATLRSWSKARYPYVPEGITPDDFYAPLKSRIADELEVPSTTIDLTDEKWLGLLEVRDDKGQLRPATESEAIYKARKDPRWQNTDKAVAQTTQAGYALAGALSGSNQQAVS
jgi:cell wall-associated NlpC family hydrolase